MTEETGLVSVRTCQGWHLAQIYKSKLEAAGIPVLLKYESAGLIFGITLDGLGEVRVLVPGADAAEAEALLEDTEDLSASEPEHPIDPTLDERDEDGSEPDPDMS